MENFILMFTVILFLSGIFINGVHSITRKGMLFGFWEEFIAKLPHWLYMPLGGCITCESSIFGTICWLFWYNLAIRINEVHFSGSVDILIKLSLVFKIGLWVFFCISLAWVNQVIYNINNYLKNLGNAASFKPFP